MNSKGKQESPHPFRIIHEGVAYVLADDGVVPRHQEVFWFDCRGHFKLLTGLLDATIGERRAVTGSGYYVRDKYQPEPVGTLDGAWERIRAAFEEAPLAVVQSYDRYTQLYLDVRSDSDGPPRISATRKGWSGPIGDLTIYGPDLSEV